MRVRWGGLGFDDLMHTANEIFIPCTGNLPASCLSSLYLSRRERCQEASHLLHYRFGESFSFTNGHRSHPFTSSTERFTSLVSNLCLSQNLCPILCNSFPSCRFNIAGQKNTHTWLGGGCFCAGLWAHFYAHCILVHSAIGHLSLCNYDQRKEVPAPQLTCRLQTRTCQLSLDQHACDGKITTQTLTQVCTCFIQIHWIKFNKVQILQRFNVVWRHLGIGKTK